jgi:type IV pilus assembly protein PilP
MFRNLGWYILFVPAFFMLSGCLALPTLEIDEWMEQTNSGLHGQVDPLPEVVPYNVFVYKGDGLTDPFSPQKLLLARMSDLGDAAPDLHRVREPLEQYDLEKLQMVGSIQQNGAIFALIQAPDGGPLIRIKVGNYIGVNHGRVIGISPSKIDVQEVIEDTNGDWVKRNATLALSDDS